MDSVGKLCVYLGVYNENGRARGYNQTAIERIMANLWGYHIKVIVIDGLHPLYKSIKGSIFSTDGTDEVVRSYDNAILIQDARFRGMAATNYAYRLASKMGYDYVLTLGADEWLDGEITPLIKTLDMLVKHSNSPPIFNLPYKDINPNSMSAARTQATRIIAYPAFVRARFAHWGRFYLDQQLKATLCITDLTIYQDDLIRPRPRERWMNAHTQEQTRTEHRDLFAWQKENRQLRKS